MVITSVGRKSGALRKNPLMRVERDGRYLAVASIGGAPQNPEWYHNFLANPVVELQDGPEPKLYRARLLDGEEREELVGVRRADLADVRPLPAEDRAADPDLPARRGLIQTGPARWTQKVTVKSCGNMRGLVS